MLLTAIMLTMMVVCCGGKTSVNNNNQADSTALSDTTRYAGLWAEKTAERVVAQFTPTNNGYNVEIGWREEGLAQYEVWTMTAHAVTADSQLRSHHQRRLAMDRPERRTRQPRNSLYESSV